jgi:hypothetical protein
MKNPFQFYDPSTGGINQNSLGYQQLITTLTAVAQKVSVQKFYEIPFADYVPVVMGNGAYQRQIINWRTYLKGEGFDTGVISNASNQSRLAHVDAAYDQVPQVIYSWAKGMMYNIFELEEAMRANTLFSLIEARETARRKEWDLGIQKIAFLGYEDSKGLLNQGDVTVNTTTITKPISSMSATEFNAFAGSVYEVYRANCNRTAKPSHLVLPEKDWNGLINFPDATFPLKTKLELLEAAFKTVTMNSAFKLMPCAYADAENFDGGLNNRYALYSYDETSVKMDLPIDYTMTQAGTVNGFTWENVAFGQFTGVVAQRPKELLYFQDAV